MKSIKKNTLIIRTIESGTIREDYAVAASVHLTLVYFVSGSGGEINLTPRVHLVGDGSSATVLGLVKGTKSASIQIHTLQHHKAPNTTSNLLIKSVLSDKSECKYDGGIRVDASAQKTDAYQRNENLLLDEHTKAVSSPALEILANDVRCTHGAVVKTLDESELWYLSTRGIDRGVSRSMIAEGFLLSAFSQIADGDERRQVEERMPFTV
ncbi:SufD family Fe-S cluster assembly protein [Patescibacteria group bacterium]|nr:SufD family Fe-S cluster assembly protein [Patescibacteria group bacterium]